MGCSGSKAASGPSSKAEIPVQHAATAGLGAAQAGTELPRLMASSGNAACEATPKSVSVVSESVTIEDGKSKDDFMMEPATEKDQATGLHEVAIETLPQSCDDGENDDDDWLSAARKAHPHPEQQEALTFVDELQEMVGPDAQCIASVPSACEGEPDADGRLLEQTLVRSAPAAAASDEATVPADRQRARAIGCSMRRGVGTGGESPEDNQDVLVSFWSAERNFGLHGLFDGHGRDGQPAARLASRELPGRVLQALQLGPSGGDAAVDPASVLQEAFQGTHRALCAASEAGSLDLQRSGSHATLVLETGGRVVTAHVGPSRAVLCRKGRGPDVFFTPRRERRMLQERAGRPEVHAVELTEGRHEPKDPQEEPRLRKCGAKIRQFEGDPYWRVFASKGFGPAVMFTRTLGDLESSAWGITCDPTVSNRALSAEQQEQEGGDAGEYLFLILASSLVWKGLKAADAVEQVLLHGPAGAQAAADALVEAAERRREARGEAAEAVCADDATALIVWFDASVDLGGGGASEAQGSVEEPSAAPAVAKAPAEPEAKAAPTPLAATAATI